MSSLRGGAPEGNAMTKRIELDDLDIDARARQQEEDARISVTTIWKWTTAEEASAFLEGVEWANDDALTAWIDGDDSYDVLVCEHERICDFDGCPRVCYGGDWRQKRELGSREMMRRPKRIGV